MKKDKYTIYHKGNAVSFLNESLIAKQKITMDHVEELKRLHVMKLDVYEEIGLTDDREELHDLADKLTNIELALQRTWGFPEDICYHKFWLTPKCICPVLDNEENYPMGYFWKSTECPLHGATHD